jgi:hypothetical protein
MVNGLSVRVQGLELRFRIQDLGFRGRSSDNKGPDYIFSGLESKG